MDAHEALKNTVFSFHGGNPKGVFSVCSSHPSVITATLKIARDHESAVLLESTSNQVNQFGGYTGMKPQDFMNWIRGLQRSMQVPERSVLVGGDHVGPFPWRNELAERAMDNAKGLAQACVAAGYSKIHLDTTMRCADDPGDRALRLDPRISAERTAELCRVAEEAWHDLKSSTAGARAPLYVIGSDVPLPGGTPAGAVVPEITRVDEFAETMDLCESAFRKFGLFDAWTRVIAVVVQPAVEHGARVIHPYVRERLKPLVNALREKRNVVFEAHATDYQTATALREMVEDGFGILKVGPSLTGAVREALFLMTHIEEILAPLAGIAPSKVPDTLAAAMMSEPRHWAPYYDGSDREITFARLYGLSDRCRYYWNAPTVEKAVQKLKDNLRGIEIPHSLLSQYFPRQYELIREGVISTDPDALIEAQIAEVLARYERAISARIREPDLNA